MKEKEMLKIYKMRENELINKDKLLDDKNSYLQYLKYIGIPEKMSKNPAVIELSYQRFKNLSEDKTNYFTSDGIINENEILTFGYMEDAFKIGEEEKFIVNDGNIELINMLTYNGKILLFERTIFDNNGIAKKYYFCDMDTPGYKCTRKNNGKILLEELEKCDSGNPFALSEKKGNDNPIKYYMLYGRIYPKLGEWMKNNFPNYKSRFEMIDEISLQNDKNEEKNDETR